MLAVESPSKLLQRKLEFSSAREPGTMDAVAGAINVATPDALKAQQAIAVELGPVESGLLPRMIGALLPFTGTVGTA